MRARAPPGISWARSTPTDFLSTADHQVSFRCSGGVRFISGVFGPDQMVSWTPGSGSWSFNSDRAGKEKLRPVDTAALLQSVNRLPLHEWNYIGYEQRHVGPMAQDFHQAFPWSGDAHTLNSADLDGVALGAIQGLNQKLEDKSQQLEARLEEKERELTELKRRLTALEHLVHQQSRSAERSSLTP